MATDPPENSSSPDQVGWLPADDGSALQETPPAKVPEEPASPVGGCRAAMLSQLKNVSAGSAGSVIWPELDSGRSTSGRLAATMRMLGLEESAGGQLHSIEENEWKAFRATALHAASSESGRGGVKSARRALASTISVAMAFMAMLDRKSTRLN